MPAFGFAFGAPFAYMINWRAIEDALRAWVKSSTGFDDAHVIWAEQTGARPSTGSFATLHLDAPRPIGVVDELTATYIPTNPNGSQVSETVNALREFSCSVSVYQTPVVEATTAPTTARSLLSQAITSLRLPSIRASLAAVGVSVADAGSIRNIPRVLETAYEGRAQVDVKFLVNETAAETDTWIQTVTGPTPTWS